MKRPRLRLILLLALLLWALPGFAQISVASFQPLENDLTANTAGTMKKDQNGRTCALIKVVTSETGFNFDVGMLGVTATEQHTGEVWVYVPEKVRFITIAHQKLGTLRQYPLPQQTESGRTYELRLTTAKVRTIIEDEQTEQFVVFHITPSDAILEFDGQTFTLDSNGGGTASCFKPFGKYNYRVERADYHTEVGVITIGAEKITKDINLRPKFGWLTVNSPIDGGDAEVYVDGRHYGNLPLQPLQLSSGNHTLKIIKPLYKTFQQPFKITDSDTLLVSANLESNYRNFTINGDDDADIYINQEYKGHGTWAGPLVSGTYRIELRRESHRTSSRSVTVKSNDTSINDVITLPAPTPIYGSLKITSTPIDADVAIDGKVVGKTPLLVGSVLVGTRSITLSKPGFRSETITATVAEGRTAEAACTMSNIASVRFTSSTPATVTIDGKAVGTTPLDVELACTDHEVSMQADGYLTRTETVNISESASVINWKLTPSQRILNISCNQKASVWVDNKYVGSGIYSTSVKLGYGEHTVTARHLDQEKRETVIIKEESDSYVNFTFRNNYIKKNAYYIGVIYQPLNFTGAGAVAGAYIKNINCEISFIMPYRTNVDYVYGDSKYVGESDKGFISYRQNLWRIDANVGYGFRVGNMVRITPRVGASGLIGISEQDGNEGLEAISVKPSVQFSFVYKKLCVIAVPEYYIPVHKGTDFDYVAKLYDKFDKATKGFNLQLALALTF